MNSNWSDLIQTGKIKGMKLLVQKPIKYNQLPYIDLSKRDKPSSHVT